MCGTLRQLVAESRQIGAIGAAGYYGFTTSGRLKIGECKIMVREMKNYLSDFCIIPIIKKYCSDTVDIVPIIGYTTV